MNEQILTSHDTKQNLVVNKLTKTMYEELSSQQRIEPKQLYFITSADTVVVDVDETGGSSTTWRKWDRFNVQYPGLRFTALAPDSSVSMTTAGTPPSVTLQYSVDDGITWETFTPGTTVVNLESIGDSMLMRAGSEGNTAIASSEDDYSKFVMTGEISASDSVMYLLDRSGSAAMSSFAFCNLFNGCSSLVSAPELPATTVYALSYAGMFENCTSLTETPELPATTLGNSCYNAMFRNCTSLSAASELPSDWLATDCYFEMFKGCTSLTTAPQMSPNHVGVRSVRDMFTGCTSLSNLSQFSLPATTLEQGCYMGTFNGCTSLTVAPELPATTLATDCYYAMFIGCSSLSSITLSQYEGNFEASAFTDWVSGVSQTGIMNYLGDDTTTGDSAIPTGWTVVKDYARKPFTVRALQSNSSVNLYRNGNPPNVSFEYSTDNGATWSPYTIDTSVSLPNVDDTVMFRNTSNVTQITTYYTNCHRFKGTGAWAVEGNIDSLLNKNFDTTTTTYGYYALGSLFEGDSNFCVQDASNLVLPDHELADSCYRGTFYNTHLVKGPQMRATTLAPHCYQAIFNTNGYLNEIWISYTGDFNGNNAFYGNSTWDDPWCFSIASSGTIHYDGTDTTRAAYAIPDNWSVQTNA